jgi:cytidylate kinase
MNIITISREFGSGGRELGKRMSDILGYDYYDKAIISALSTQLAQQQNDQRRTAEGISWRSIPYTYRHSFIAPATLHTVQSSRLLEEKKVMEYIAQQGKDCIIVGQNADVLLQKFSPLNLFVCAEMQARVDRCVKHAREDEDLTPKQIERNIRALDKERAASRAILTERAWGQRDAYHLTVNTTTWEIKALAPIIADFALRFFER